MRKIKMALNGYYAQMINLFIDQLTDSEIEKLQNLSTAEIIAEYQKYIRHTFKE